MMVAGARIERASMRIMGPPLCRLSYPASESPMQGFEPATTRLQSGSSS